MDSCYFNIIPSNVLSEKDKKISRKLYLRAVKTRLLKTGEYDTYKNIRSAQNSKYLAQTYGTELNSKLSMYLSVEQHLSMDEEYCCDLIRTSYYKRVKRAREYITNMLSKGRCLFLTLTFTDNILNSTSVVTRRRYIQRYLSSLPVNDYLSNIDFGDKDKNEFSKNREHYHAIVQTDNNIDYSSYEYGLINGKVIVNTDKSINKLSKYINKLTYHAFKTSTGLQYRLIYPKKKMCENTIN